jgi:hypothetical protein
MRNKKKGAPIKEVTTPSINSRCGEITRTIMSAAVMSRAPPTALGINKAEGRWRTRGRKRWGTTKPTKPIEPVTATARLAQGNAFHLGAAQINPDTHAHLRGPEKLPAVYLKTALI